jgi:hypothetical protein
VCCDVWSAQPLCSTQRTACSLTAVHHHNVSTTATAATTKPKLNTHKKICAATTAVGTADVQIKRTLRSHQAAQRHRCCHAAC